MAVVTFDLAGFRARYPEFAAVSDGQLAAFFTESGLYLSNDDCSPVTNVTRRSLLLNMIVAHIAYLNGYGTGGDGSGGSRPVGRLSAATEGTVSATFENGSSTSASQAWWEQSPYGSAFYQATLNLRRFRYIANPTNINGANRQTLLVNGRALYNGNKTWG